MGTVVSDPACLYIGHRGPHHFIVFVVHTRSEAEPADLREAGVEILWRDTRKALQIRIERRELESGDPGLDHSRDVLGPVSRIDRSIEREVHARLFARFLDLLPNPIARANQK